MNREPCSITDDPFNDYSDYVENEGVYKSKYAPKPRTRSTRKSAKSKSMLSIHSNSTQHSSTA